MAAVFVNNDRDPDHARQYDPGKQHDHNHAEVFRVFYLGRRCRHPDYHPAGVPEADLAACVVDLPWSLILRYWDPIRTPACASAVRHGSKVLWQFEKLKKSCS